MWTITVAVVFFALGVWAGLSKEKISSFVDRYI